MSEEKIKSSQILAASSTLLGLCFVVFSSIKLMQIDERTIIDELTTIVIVLFMTSSILSFLAIRDTIKESGKLMKLAECFFLVGLSMLFITTLLFSSNIIR